MLDGVLMVTDVGVTTTPLAPVHASPTPVAAVVFGVVVVAGDDVLYHAPTTSGSFGVHHVHD